MKQRFIKYFYTILFSLYLLIEYNGMVYGLNTRTITFLISLVLGAHSIRIKEDKAWMLPMFVMVVCSTLIIAVRGFGTINPPYHEFFYLLVSAYILKKDVSIEIFKITFGAICILILYRYISNFDLFFFSADADKISFFDSSSLNYISVWLLSLLGVLYYQERKQGQVVSVWPSVIALFIILLSKSRTGLACTLILLIAVVYVNMQQSGIKISLSKVILALCGITLISFYGLEFVSQAVGIDIIESDFLTSKYTERGTSYSEDPRSELLFAYISSLDPLSLVLGYDYHKTSIGNYLEFTHNSFLQLHYNLGIFFFYFIYLLVKSARFLYRRDTYLLIVMACVFLRSFTDDMFFINRFDFTAFLFLLIPFYVKFK